MKLNKKFLSCFLAGTMVMAPMSAFAASSTITGSGTVKPLDTEIYNVVLPTSDGIEFTVDPFGLLSITDSKSLAEVVSDAAGTVTSAATAVVNKSSVDVSVSVETWMTVSGASLTLTDDIEEAKSGAADLYLAITEVSGASVTAVTAGDAIDDAGLDEGVAGLGGATITGGTLLDAASGEAVTAVTSAAANAFSFTLEDVANLYTVDSTGQVTLDESSDPDYSASSYVFAITGYANPESEAWNALGQAGTLELNMKFTLSGDNAKAAYWTLANKNYWVGTDSTVTTGFNNITDVKINGAAPEGGSGDYVIDGDFLYLKPAVLAYYQGKNNGKCVVTITDANGTYEVTIQ